MTALSLSKLSRKIAIPVALLLALAAAPALTGCSGNPVEGIVKGVSGGKVDIGGTSIPSDFPKSVPLYKGTIISVAALGSAKQKIFNIGITVPGPAAMSDIKKQLATAGFKTEVEGNVGKVGASLITENKDYSVAVLLAKSGKGYQANYTVTPVDQSN
jgi:hypothetical protein